jgi:hypothetical protein
MQTIARPLAFAIVASLTAFTACHARAADPPRATSPSMDVEIDDRGPDKSSHLAKLSVGFVNGQAKVWTQDGEARYEVDATTVRQPNAPYVELHLKRGPGNRPFEKPYLDLDVEGTVPTPASGRVVIARLDRGDGHSTTVSVQVR